MIKTLRTGLLILAVTAAMAAQSPAHKSAPAPTIPALFLSDIHFDPFADPALVPKLNAAPAADWATILVTPASATQQTDEAAVQKACPVRGNDTSAVLWRSSLQALHAQASHARFATLTGDLLAHDFDCKYRILVPAATPADYLTFIEKTLVYVFSTLRSTLPGVPIYTALGNNDTACSGNHLDANSEFLARIAPILADALDVPNAARPPILRDIASGGFYSTLISGPHTGITTPTRLIVVDNLFFLSEYGTCARTPDRSEEAAQITWLNTQLAEARTRHENVWVIGHIPPGVSLYTTFLQRRNICGGQPPAMSLDSEKLAQALADNADIVRLAIFAHTHSDAFALIPPNLGDPPPVTPLRPHLGLGVPVKVVASISPVNGNNPSFTLATVDPATATLRDYTVIEASNLTGIDTTWAKQYTYSEDYAEPDFSPASLANLIATFRADPAAESSASQAYLRHHYSTGAAAAVLKTFWPVYVCAMDHDSGPSFTACACATGVMPPVQ
jgi:sphingomyelin phosphodiesterase acid-like 3